LGALVGDRPNCLDLGKFEDVDPRRVSDDGRLENLGYQPELVAGSGVDGFSRSVCLGRDRADGRGGKPCAANSFDAACRIACGSLLGDVEQELHTDVV
jgi:hypothetical protein